MPSGVAA